MATNKLGKVVAGAALGGASLLVFAPGLAFADSGGDGDHRHHNEGKVYADPHAVRPGHDVKLIEVCVDRQEHAYVWSEVTGKIKLHPRDHHKKEHEGGWNGNGREGGDSEGGWTVPEGEGSEGGWNGREGEGSNGGDWQERGDEAAQQGNRESGGWGGGEADKKAEEEAAKKKAEEEAARKKAEEEAAKKKAEEEAAAEGEGPGKEHDKEPKFVYYGKAEIPWDAEPGTYKLKGSCGEGTLVVLPRGHVPGGDGGVTGGDNTMALGGAAMLGAAALGGIVLMRRRQADELV